MKRYGMILADNGSACYMIGAPDERRDIGELRQLKNWKNEVTVYWHNEYDSIHLFNTFGGHVNEMPKVPV